MTSELKQGELVWVNLNPRSGHEQSGHRPALVISPELYHSRSSLAIICPITSNLQPWPWKVFLPEDSPIEGAILTDQMRSIDRDARKLKIIGHASKDIVGEVLAKISALLGVNI